MIAPLDIFQTEAREHLEKLESALLSLESSPSDEEMLNQAFRSMHTIKGGAGMYGFDDLTEFTHHLESALDKVRKSEININRELIGILLDAGDLINDLLSKLSFDAHQRILTSQLLTRLFELVPIMSKQDTDQQGELIETSIQSSVQDEEWVYRIRFTPDLHTFENGFDVLPVLRELHEFGQCVVTTQSSKLPTIDKLNAEHCYLSWDIILVTQHAQKTIQETFMFVEDDWDITIEIIDLHDDSEDADRVGELLVRRNIISPQAVEQTLSSRNELGHMLIDQGLVNKDEINAAIAEQKLVRELKSHKNINNQDATIRVPAGKLDSLMNLVGELVIVQARLNQVATTVENDHIHSIAEELEMLTTEMRDETFNIRMMPIGSTFGRFRRLVRDLSNDLDKSIELVTFGAQTELDKMVLDKLSDPLIHLIRNSIDHGIEDPSTRTAIGKPEKGRVTLSAFHSDSQVVIEIQDDGKGLDTQKIFAKAVEKNIIQASASLSDSEIFSLMFEPGLSTAAKVSDISGRGVGMDVVKRSINELGGSISVASTPNVGTTLTIKLPTTLAIIEGLMVSVESERYVLPLSCVEECIELNSGSKQYADKHGLVEVRGELIPFLNLRSWFQSQSARPEIEQIVVAHIGDEKFGFCVDEVIGQYQTVIKQLGKLYEGVVGYSGATILGDGTVAIILDPQALIEYAASNE